MKSRGSIGLAAAVVWLASASLSAQVQLGASLDGNQETPPVPTAATAIGWVTLNQPANTLTYRVIATGLSSAPVAAHFHSGAVGVAGPVVFGITQTSPNSWEGTTPALSAAQVAAVLSGGWYLNLHTANFGGGEVRGQVQIVTRRRLVATLTGGAEVPPVPTAASGTASFWLEQPMNTVAYDVQATGLSAFAAHIHVGPAGVNGPILRGLNPGPTHWCGKTTAISASEATTLLTGGCYVNAHTNANPGGEIRGQITLAPLVALVSKIDGTQENPPVATPATGLGRYTLDPSTGVLNYRIAVNGLLGTVTASHFHRANQGTNGPVVINVGLPTGPGNEWQGTTTLTPTQVEEFLQQKYYFNVHTVFAGGGEARGQLEPNAESYGFGFEGGPNGMRELDSTGLPAINNLFTILVRGGNGAGAATLFLSGINTSFGGGPLPLDLTPAGLPGNWVWMDPTLALQIPVALDSAGCASLPIFIPNDINLFGLTVYVQALISDGSGTSVSNALRVIIQ